MGFSDKEKEMLIKLVSVKYNYCLNQRNSAYIGSEVEPDVEKHKRRYEIYVDECDFYDGLLKKVINL